jgi:hypothetical protein
MKHLTVDEIIDFVSFKQINDETMALASKVNHHIFTCEDCLRKVRAFRMVSKSFKVLAIDPELRKEIAAQAKEFEKEMLGEAPAKQVSVARKKQ